MPDGSRNPSTPDLECAIDRSRPLGRRDFRLCRCQQGRERISVWTSPAPHEQAPERLMID